MFTANVPAKDMHEDTPEKRQCGDVTDPCNGRGPEEMSKNDEFREEGMEQQHIVVKKAKIISTQGGLDGNLCFRYTALLFSHQIAQTAFPEIISQE